MLIIIRDAGAALRLFVCLFVCLVVWLFFCSRTADVYSFVIGILFFKIEFYWLYFPAFVAVLAGIVIYTRAPERRGDAETDGPLVVKGKGDPGQWG